MNKELVYAQDSVFVNTDNGLQKRQNNDNIEEILITENNIEEIENKIQYIDKQIVSERYKKTIEKLTLKYLKFFLEIAIPPTLLAIFLFNLTTIPSLIPIIIIYIFGTVMIPSTLASIKTHNLYKAYSKRQLELLSNELENQKQKLNKLNNDKISNNTVHKQNSLKKIEKSKLIEDLKRKLELIEIYQENSKQWVEFAKDHFLSIKLREMRYSERDISFILTLIQEDSKYKTDEENKKEKTFKKL